MLYYWELKYMKMSCALISKWNWNSDFLTMTAFIKQKYKFNRKKSDKWRQAIRICIFCVHLYNNSISDNHTQYVVHFLILCSFHHIILKILPFPFFFFSCSQYSASSSWRNCELQLHWKKCTMQSWNKLYWMLPTSNFN